MPSLKLSLKSTAPETTPKIPSGKNLHQTLKHSGLRDANAKPFLFRLVQKSLKTIILIGSIDACARS